MSKQAKQSNGNETPSIGVGSIYRIGAKWYFEDKGSGISRKSLKTADPQVARERALERFGYLLYKDASRQAEDLIARHTRAKEQYQDAIKPTVPVSDILLTWGKTLQTQASNGKLHEDSGDLVISPRTLRARRENVARFVDWLKSSHIEIETADEITPAVAQEYLTYLLTDGKRGQDGKAKGGLSKASAQRHIADLRKTLRDIRLQASIKGNPFDEVQHYSPAELRELAKRRGTRHRVATDAELDTIREGVKSNPVLSLLFELGLETGLRIGDMITLELDELDGDYLDMTTRKGVKSQILYIPETAPQITEHIKRTKPEQYVFGAEAERYRKDDTAISKQLSRVLTALEQDGKLKIETPEGRLGWHSLRVYHATALRASGASMAQVQSELGHTDSRTTEGYIQESKGQTKARLKAMRTRQGLDVEQATSLIKDVLGGVSDSDRAEVVKSLLEALKR